MSRPTIRTLSKLPVKFLINTHYHLDHVGANAVFVDAGAIVLAHRNVRSWIHRENIRMFGTDIKPQQRACIEALPPSTVTYDQPMDLYVGAREILARSCRHWVTNTTAGILSLTLRDRTSCRQTPS
jgi:cyclase